MESKTYSFDQAIVDRLMLENTRVLFDFMQELSNLCTNLAEPITNDWKYKGYIGDNSLNGRQSILATYRDEVCSRVKGCYRDSQPLLQNSLSSYWRFYKAIYIDADEKIDSEVNVDEKIDNECKKIAEMLNYFNILRYLTEPEFKEKRHEGFDSLPYIFEDICLSIKNMTSAKSCYLVYKKEGEVSQLVSRSGYVIDATDKQASEFLLNDEEKDRFSSLNIGSTEFDLLIKCSCMKMQKGNDDTCSLEIEKSNKTDIEGISVITEKQKPKDGTNINYTHTFLLLDFPYSEGECSYSVASDTETEKGGDKRRFYVILELNEKDIDVYKDRSEKPQNLSDTMKILIRILFLRNRLLEALRKYYASIINFRFYCNYIKPIIGIEDEKVQILHLTDLHLYDDEAWGSRSCNTKFLCDQIKMLLKGSKSDQSEVLPKNSKSDQIVKLLKNSKIDLIAVTGDVVNASDDAATAQRKYKRLAVLLFELAKTLWGVQDTEATKTILPHDWKRRILVTTGNHDYAAMNDVRVQTESRKIKMGLPAKSSGGTMAKYTYFLEFLSYFLDAPTQKLLSSDLNEVREYDHLGFIVGLFNSCSQANALQNNKVSFDSEKLELVLERGNWRKTNKKHVAFAHHPPSYGIDYFKDKYEAKGMEEIYSSYIRALGNYLLREGMLLAADLPEKTPKNESTFDVDDFVEKFTNFKKDIESSGKWDFMGTELFKDMELLCNILNKSCRHPDEYIFRNLYDASTLFKTIKEDNNRFQRDWKKIVCDDLTVIAGHTHEADYIARERDKKYDTIIGKRFYKRKDEKDDEREDKGDYMSFSILSFRKNSEGFIAQLTNFKGKAKNWTNTDVNLIEMR